MSGELFYELVALLAPRISKNDTSFRKAILVKECVAVGLWRLATENLYQCITRMVAIGRSTAVKISKGFSSLLTLQSCTYIKFPNSAVATKHAIETFKADYNYKIPQSLGAIDCPHIFIIADYCCRKQRYSINTQAVVGANHCFLDVATGFLGSMHNIKKNLQPKIPTWEGRIRRDFTCTCQENLKCWSWTPNFGWWGLSTTQLVR